MLGRASAAACSKRIARPVSIQSVHREKSKAAPPQQQQQQPLRMRGLLPATAAQTWGAPAPARASRQRLATSPLSPGSTSASDASAPRRPTDGSERAVTARAAASSKPANPPTSTNGDGAIATHGLGKGGATQPPSDPPPQLPSYRHLIIPPPLQQQPPPPGEGSPDRAAAASVAQTAGGASGGGEECLLAIVPGALLPPAAFQALAEAVQKAAAPHLRLWVGVMNVDFLSIKQILCGPDAAILEVLGAMEVYGAYGKLLGQVVEQAAAQGFVAHTATAGRLSNMAVVCQSAGCFGFAPAAARAAAATVVLGGMPNAHDYLQMGVFSMEAWPRPLMVLAGELDGQMRWPLLSTHIAESAAMAAKFGPGFAAAHKPVVVIPGLNHGNSSNGETRLARGDITAGVADHAACMAALGGLIASFATAHMSQSERARSQARRALLDAVRHSAQLTAPYCIARGLGDVTAPYVTAATAATLPPLEPPSAASVGPCRVGGLVAGAQRVAGRAASTALPPGEVVAAEAHAEAIQRRVLAGLPGPQLQRLRVVATAHTDVETFLYSQPEMVPLGEEEEEEEGVQGRDTVKEGGTDGGSGSGGRRWLLHVHVLLHFKSLDAPGQSLAPQAPDYWLKLKCAHFVAALLGLPEPSQYGSPDPAQLNALALEAALEAVPAGVSERYRTLGRQMEFGPDVDVLAPGPDGAPPAASSPEAFVRLTRIAFRYPPPPPPHAAGDTPTSTPTPATGPSAGAAAAPAGAGQPHPGPGSVRVCSPYLLVAPPVDVGSRSLGEIRFMGPYYVKLLSVAQAMEWVLLDSMREMNTPW